MQATKVARKGKTPPFLSMQAAKGGEEGGKSHEPPGLSPPAAINAQKRADAPLRSLQGATQLRGVPIKNGKALDEPMNSLKNLTMCSIISEILICVIWTEIKSDQMEHGNLWQKRYLLWALSA